MNKNLFFFSLLFLFGLGNVLAQGDYASHKAELEFNKSKVLQHLQTLSSDLYEGRETGTNGAERARKYIINQFYTLGAKPLIEGYAQQFTFSEKKKIIKAFNILALIKGTDYKKDYIVISAHYDHEGVKGGDIYNGADDNASGVSALFAFAEYLKNNPPKHSVILAAFDAEEKGLLGAKHMVNNSIIGLKNIVLNINMDMISRSDKNELYVVGPRYTPMLKDFILNQNNSEDIKLRIGHEGLDKADNWTYSSDHMPFHKKGIPFLYFGVEDHKDYHQPSDDFENVHPKFYISAIDEIITVFKKADAIKSYKN